jgi:hypothetical protein
MNKAKDRRRPVQRPIDRRSGGSRKTPSNLKIFLRPDRAFFLWGESPGSYSKATGGNDPDRHVNNL